MKHKTLFNLLAILGLVLALGSSIPMTHRASARTGTAAKAGTGYISIAAGALYPSSGDCDYLNLGPYLMNNDGDCLYVGGVQLPQGATVTKLTAYWSDYSSQEISAGLNRVPHGLVTDYTLAWVESSGNSGDGSGSDTDIDYATIDHSLYAYYVWWNLPDKDLTAQNIVIEYTYSTSLPLVQSDS